MTAHLESVVALTGAVDLDRIDEVYAELVRAIEALAADDVLILDVSDVTFFDSVTLGLMVRARNDCLVRGAGIRLRGVPERGLRLLALSGLSSIFTVEQPVDRGGPGRLPAMTSLPAHPDAMFDQIAALVRRVLGVPTALVTLVDESQQVFPGAIGLPDPWQALRCTPLSHSFCQHVVTGGRPLVVRDARTDALLADNLAISDLGVIAYAGIPLADTDGTVVGSLCAIDSVPRQWTELQLANLTDLALVCSSELQKRGVARRATAALERERIAEDLRKRVVTDLYGVTIDLNTVRGAGHGPSDALLSRAVDTIDATITAIRNTIFRPERF